MFSLYISIKYFFLYLYIILKLFKNNVLNLLFDYYIKINKEKISIYNYIF